MTLEEVSERSGLGKGLLSKVENFRVTPTLITLSRIADALGVAMVELLKGLDEEPKISLVRKGERRVIERNRDEAGGEGKWNNFYESLAHKRADRTMEPFEIRVPARGGRNEALRHEGEEFLTVLEGSPSFEYNGEIYQLEVGDSLYFDAGADHRLFNETDRDARVLSVMWFGSGL